MGRDRFREAIEAALSGRIEPNLFEECAVSLLRDEVPTLVLLAGGDDHGLDGMSSDGAVGLVVTTGDAISNLRKNLSRHLKTGGQTRRILFATPRSLTNLQRRNLVNAASGLGFDLAEGGVYEQKAFTERLYRNSVWRMNLLGIPGAPPALSEYPLSLRPSVDIPLVGRREELAKLESASGDVLLVGEPGAGKTFLTERLVASGRALFVVDFDADRLADALRDMCPATIISEDVHFQGQEVLATVVQLRKSLGLDFTLICTTWPARAQEWAQLTHAQNSDRAGSAFAR